MNYVDLVIVGAIALFALIGLKSGILGMASGMGGLVLGVVLALQYHGQLSFALEQHVDGDA